LKSAMALVKGQTGAVPENMSKTLGLMRQCCEDSGLTVALYLTSRLIHFSEGDRPLAASAAFEQLNAIANSVEAELTQLTCFRISAEDAKYFTDRRLFGEEVATKFVPANQDIEEAGKCLALSRGTATVFHLMRVMEAGLKALAKPLGIP